MTIFMTIGTNSLTHKKVIRNIVVHFALSAWMW